MNEREAIGASRTETATASVLWLMGIAALFMAVGAITLYLANALHGMVPGISPLKLGALYAGWLVAWGGALLYLRYRHPEADLLLLPPVALLTGLGLLLQARLAPGFLDRQILWLLAGVGIMCATSSIHTLTRLLRRYRYTLLVGGLLLLAATLLFGVNPSGAGARLWLGGLFGFYFQPSELLKLLLLIYLAAYLADRRELPENAPRRLALWPPVLGPMLLMLGLALVLLAWQEDLGAALLFYLSALAMLYLAWGRIAHVLVGVLMFVPVALAGAQLSARVALRASIWLNPWAPEQADRAFQILQSLFAVAAGGLFGQGLGLGRPDLIPVVHSDFVYAAVVNEFGVAGAIAVLALLAWFLQRSLRLARHSAAPFETLLAGGIAAWIGIQTWVIIGGNLKLIPLTGVTLPFLSYGGSSLVTLMIAVGLLLNISIPHPLPASLPLGKRGLTSLHRNILGLGNGLLALLTICALDTGYWAVLRADALRDYPTNPHRILAEMRIHRGRILDRRGGILADIVVDPRGYVERTYPAPEAAPVVGYATLEYGAEGIEGACDNALRGDVGRTTWTAAQDQLLQRAAQGSDVRLTLDARMQQQAQQLLEQREGAILLVDSHTGAILALASAPTYDPATVAASWDTLREDPTSPLLNRATQAPVQPGGALQTLIVAVALEQDLPEAQLVQSLAAPVVWNDYVLTCRTSPGAPSWESALASACPAPFAAAGKALSAEQLAELFARWGLSTAPKLELPVIVADWNAADVDPIMEALGQGNLLVTPLQMAGVVATLANDGVRPPLHLLETAQPGCPTSPTGQTPVLAVAHAIRLRNSWSRWGEAVGHLSTALAGPERTLTWFLGINSPELPRFAVVVLLENAADPAEAAEIGEQLLGIAVAPPNGAP
ncbi:MAG: FtsW/RodA/SpoVE family cell cycle protein [Anaerolineae bacterium]|nr:FtsW/RodA/SpoVE family cell cycle protein [Anaerolineae bacterium]